MTLLKYSEVKKMDNKARELKLKDLKLELVKANVTANKTNAKTKEIKRAISRLFTYSSLQKLEKNKEKTPILNNSEKDVEKK